MSNTMEIQKAGQIVLPFINLTADAQRVLGTKGLIDKDGNQVGISLKAKSRKDIAAEFDLKPREDSEEITRLELAQKDEAFKQLKAWIVGVEAGKGVTLDNATFRNTKKGAALTVKLLNVKRKQGPSDEEIAKALGWTVEQVAEARDRQVQALKDQEENTVEV